MPMTVRRTRRAVLLLALAPGLAGAADTGDLARCAGIADDVARLACYDRMARPQTPESPRPAPAPPDGFGAETMKNPSPAPGPAEPDEVHSRIAAKFTGWQRGTRFPLENGQVWESIDDRSPYVAFDHPEVTVRKTWAGGYELVIGDWRIRVRRVK